MEISGVLIINIFINIYEQTHTHTHTHSSSIISSSSPSFFLHQFFFVSAFVFFLLLLLSTTLSKVEGGGGWREGGKVGTIMLKIRLPCGFFLLCYERRVIVRRRECVSLDFSCGIHPKNLPFFLFCHFFCWSCSQYLCHDKYFSAFFFF